MKYVFTIIYFLGLASCGIQGVQKADKNHLNTPKRLLSAFLSAFGGGLTRDVWILHTHPAVFAISCLPEIIIALGSALLYSHFMCTNSYINLFTIIADSAGLAQFITIGIDRALSFKEDYAFAVLSGVCTSLGGGIISSIFSGESIKKTMCSNPIYRITDLIGAIIYAILLKNNVDRNCAQATIVIFTLLFATPCNHIVIQAIEMLVKKALKIIPLYNTYTNWSFVLVMIKLSFLSNQFCGKIDGIIVSPIRQPILNRQRTFLYHRLRQM